MPFKDKPPSIVYWLGNNLYLNITNRCSNNCYFCFRKYKDGINGFNLKLHEEPTPSHVIKELQEVMNRKNWREMVFCGFGEPLMRLDCVLEVTKQVKKLFNATVRIDTNGQAYLINKGRNVIEELRDAGIDRMSVSLNAHDKQTYNYVCKPKFENAFENVLKFIEKARKTFETEIATVTIPEVNILRVEEMAREIGVKFRIREYSPASGRMAI